MVWFVGLTALSVFIHDRPSHCPPRLAPPRDLEEIGLWEVLLSQDVV